MIRATWLSMVAALLLTAPEAVADGMRCGKRLISNGARPQEVQSKCGNPQAIDQRLEFETLRRRIVVPCPSGANEALCFEEESYTITHTVETWTYDFGKRRLVHYAEFFDGKLRAVATGGYGTRDEDDEPER